MNPRNNPTFISRDKIFAAYVGSSMNPTLQEPELLEIVPYGSRPIGVGDVVFFRSPETQQQVVHRVVRVIPAGIATRGDNNSLDDHCLLKPKDIIGRVMVAWRGSRSRPIAGGRRGLWISRGLPWKRRLDRGGSYLLHPIYYAFAYRGYLARIIPKGLRPKIVVIQNQGQSRPCLFLGKRLVGRYDDRSRQWQIQRPFRLMVDVHKLPIAPHKE
jgi:hypothetical protein